jgi:hypothetical protein
MTTEYVLSHERAREMVMNTISKLPLSDKTLITIGKVSSNRTDAQNKLSFSWYKAISEQTGETPAEARAYCKLHFGVAVLREGSKKFREFWDGLDMPYESQLVAMEYLPVTRLFTTRQFTEYLGAIEHFYNQEGVVLPHPEDSYYSAMGI